jgi:hypothetical protein
MAVASASSAPVTQGRGRRRGSVPSSFPLSGRPAPSTPMTMYAPSTCIAPTSFASSTCPSRVVTSSVSCRAPGTRALSASSSSSVSSESVVSRLLRGEVAVETDGRLRARRSRLGAAGRVGKRRTLREMGTQVYEIDESLGYTFGIRLHGRGRGARPAVHGRPESRRPRPSLVGELVPRVRRPCHARGRVHRRRDRRHRPGRLLRLARGCAVAGRPRAGQHRRDPLDLRQGDLPAVLGLRVPPLTRPTHGRAPARTPLADAQTGESVNRPTPTTAATSVL